jgi:hypothetical protein
MSRLPARFLLIFAIAAMFSATAIGQNSHSVWSDKPLLIRDDEKNIEYKTFEKGDAIFAWTQATIRAYAHAHGKVSATLNYDFMLVKTTGSDVDSISGLFDVRRNGVLVCNNCVGKAYWLSPIVGPGNYFKIYVGTPAGYAEKWLYSGERNKRFDF